MDGWMGRCASLGWKGPITHLWLDNFPPGSVLVFSAKGWTEVHSHTHIHTRGERWASHGSLSLSMYLCVCVCVSGSSAGGARLAEHHRGHEGRAADEHQPPPLLVRQRGKRPHLCEQSITAMDSLTDTHTLALIDVMSLSLSLSVCVCVCVRVCVSGWMERAREASMMSRGTVRCRTAVFAASFLYSRRSG